MVLEIKGIWMDADPGDTAWMSGEERRRLVSRKLTPHDPENFMRLSKRGVQIPRGLATKCICRYDGEIERSVLHASV